MKKLFHDRNFMITAGLIAAAAAVLILSLTLRPGTPIPEGAERIDFMQDAKAPGESAPAQDAAEAPRAPDGAAGNGEGAKAPEEPAVPAGAEGAAPQPEASRDTIQRAKAYVYCRLPASGQYGFIPLPGEGAVSYPIHQTFTDGTSATNIIHLTPAGFCMEYSTCENQDCVGEGFVSLENREERILGNAVYCLPNQVILQIYSPEEMEAMGFTLTDEAGTDAGAEG